MADYSALTAQEIPAGGSAVFTTTIVPSYSGFIRHNDGTPNFLLSGGPYPYPPFGNGEPRCCCNRDPVLNYLADFKGNIAIATGGTAGEISIAISIDGTPMPASIMRSTPAAAEEYNNVSVGMTIPIFAGTDQTITVMNTSNQPILLEGGLLRLNPLDIYDY